MTSAEIFQELESKAWAQGRDAGLEQGLERGRDEEARRAVRVAFECRFGAMPSILEAALAKVHDLEGLHLCLQACLRESRDEVVRLLDAAVHRVASMQLERPMEARKMLLALLGLPFCESVHSGSRPR